MAMLHFPLILLALLSFEISFTLKQTGGKMAAAVSRLIFTHHNTEQREKGSFSEGLEIEATREFLLAF